MPHGFRTLSIYGVTGAAYITLSVFFPRVILSWVEAAAVLMLVFLVAPYLYDRLRR
jgi:hypothetical protein